MTRVGVHSTVQNRHTGLDQFILIILKDERQRHQLLSSTIVYTVHLRYIKVTRVLSSL